MRISSVLPTLVCAVILFGCMSADDSSTTAKTNAKASHSTTRAAAKAMPPQSGWWWNPAESGRGFAIERQGDTIFMAAFLYEVSGAATWYASILKQQSDGTYTGALTRYTGGQSLLGSYKAPTSTTNVANAVLNFDSGTSGVLTVTPSDGTSARNIVLSRFPISSPGFQASNASFETGWYWSATQSGRGFFIEVQGSTAFIGSFMYDAAGQPTWYATSAPVQNGKVLNGQLEQYINGQSLTGPFRAATSAGQAGNLGFNFADATAGNMTLPNGSPVGLTRFTFNPMGWQPDYEPVAIISKILTPLVTPIPSDRTIASNKQYFYRYSMTRARAVVDINGDGLDDLVVAPTLFDQKPELPIEIWINKGDGTFENQTSTWIVGTPPKTGFALSIIVADFNGDGRADILLVDSGLETTNCVTVRCPGSINRLLLSDSTGRLTEATAKIPNNALRFNHILSSVGDINGDGRKDIAITNLGETANLGDGVVLHLNLSGDVYADRSADMLSDEVGYRLYSYQFSNARPANYDRQNVGATAAVDLDGDDKAELLTCSYSGDRFSKRRTVRIHKLSDATQKFVEVSRFTLPAALLNLPPSNSGFIANQDDGVGCAGIQVADVDGDGILDLMIHWERWGDSYLQIMRGKGGFQYEDYTLTALGTYVADFTSNGYTRTASGARFVDVNGDGAPDIVILNLGVTPQQLADANPTVWINNGRGVFSRQRLQIAGAATSGTQLNTILKCTFCDYSLLFGRFVPRTDNRKALDLLLWNNNEDLSPAPVMEKSVTLRVLKAR